MRKTGFTIRSLRCRDFGVRLLTCCGATRLQCPDGQCGADGAGGGSRQLEEGAVLSDPDFAYMLGAFVSELCPNPVKHRLRIRWESMLLAIEMAFIVGLGFLPESAPVQISQVAINFIASMQYNTFRQGAGDTHGHNLCDKSYPSGRHWTGKGTAAHEPGR